MATKLSAKKKKTITIAGIAYTLLFAGHGAGIGDRTKTDKCGGIERWAQKVVIDDRASNINSTPKLTTMADLNSIKTSDIPIGNSTERLDTEDQVYTIKNCFISEAFLEDDKDFHLAIEDGGGHHMVAEIPDPACPEAKQSDFIKDYKLARKTFLHHKLDYNHFRFDITGVLFIDKKHPKPPVGNWPNNIELHPVIKLVPTSQF